MTKFFVWASSHFQRGTLIAFTFAAVMLIGSLLLMLPAAHRNGAEIQFIDALFVSVSAVSVTGLTTIDAGNQLTVFGQLILICLIQIGGLGIMTIAVFFGITKGRRMGLQERLLIQDSFNMHTPAGMAVLVKKTAEFTFFTEGIIGTILAVHLYLIDGPVGIYWGYWHAVSAFCNAGFDLMGDFRSLTGYTGDWVTNLMIMIDIVLGGIGFPVINDIRQHRKWSRLNLHSKIVMITTVILLAVGTVFFYFLETGNVRTIGMMSGPEQWLAAAFQSVSARTAGFNTVDIAALGPGTMFLLMVLMFIGGGPASTAGGIKVSTFAVLVLTARSLIKGKKSVVVFRRRIEDVQIRKAAVVLFMSLAWVIVAGFLIMVFDGGRHSFLLSLFETVSAFATTGLGTGITTEWNTLCKIVLILTMFVGRVGLLTLVLTLSYKDESDIRYPTDKVII